MRGYPSGSTGDGITTERYLTVEMPECFALEFQTADGEWMVEATCSADMFDRLDDGPADAVSLATLYRETQPAASTARVKVDPR